MPPNSGKVRLRRILPHASARLALYNIIGTQGVSHISTHYVAGLSGSELAQLQKNGASDEVVDQEKFLAEFIEFDCIRYRTWGKVSGSPK